MPPYGSVYYFVSLPCVSGFVREHFSRWISHFPSILAKVWPRFHADQRDFSLENWPHLPRNDRLVSALGTQTSEPKHRRRPDPDPDRASVPRDTEVLVMTLKADAERAGYRTQRAYLEALIAQGLVPEEGREPDEQTQSLAAAYPSSAWALGPTILANRVVLAIEALTQRIRDGEDVAALGSDLLFVRQEIVEHLMALRADYDREVQARDRRHYARFGPIDE